MRGTLFLVVGPSGSGKDSLINGAKAAFAGDDRFHFPRRHITRPAEAGGENHIEVSEALFAARQAGGGYALSWRAHGLGYGIPSDIQEMLVRGRHVVVNVSRTVIDQARHHLAPVRVLLVTAGPEVLARRLAARGRESADDIRARIARAGEFVCTGNDVTVLRNEGDLDEALEQFIATLRNGCNAPHSALATI